MASGDFDELIAQAKQIGASLGDVFEEVTGERLDLESTIKHYPLIAVGLGIGMGAIAGWWVGSKREFPPSPPAAELPGETDTTTSNWLSGLFTRAVGASTAADGQQVHPLDRLESLFPAGAEKVRDVLPDIVSEEAATMAKTWVDSVLEPKLRQGIDTMASNVSDSKLGSFFKQRFAGTDEGDDHHLEDPEPPAAV